MSPAPFRFKIAIATDDDKTVNGHFGGCNAFAIYQFDADSLEHLETRPAAVTEGVEKNGVRAAQLVDCHLLYVADIGGPAAAKVIKSGIYPLKDKNKPLITDVLTKLQQVLKGTPPPWMAKLMGQPSPLADLASQGTD